MNELICPFCGKSVHIQLTDNEGNFHSDDYLDEPYSGVGYVLTHYEEDEVECPIACEDGEFLGMYIYDTKRDAIESWRVKYA